MFALITWCNLKKNFLLASIRTGAIQILLRLNDVSPAVGALRHGPSLF